RYENEGSRERSSTMRPTTLSGTSSSGINLVASRMSKGNASAWLWESSCTPNLPFREISRIDRLVQVTAVIVLVGAGDLHGLIPAGGLRPQLRPPMELDEGRLVLVVYQPEGVHTESFHHAQ